MNLTRDEFRDAVFQRDNHACVFCNKPAVDAHHLIERRLWANGGYFLANGISVCEEHHLACEMTLISVEEGRQAAGINTIVVPDQFYPEQPITKWGDYLLDDGRRTRGELFYDESVQKILERGGVLHLYTPYVKYGRTNHLPWSPGIHDDDKALKDCRQFEGEEVVVTVKMDGENTTGYSDGHIHARSIDSRGGEDRAWVKQFLSERLYDLPAGWRICGENLWAEHSIHYDDLPSYFLGFSLWDDRNNCLSWDETLEYFQLLGVTPVETIWRGVWDEAGVRAACDMTINEWGIREGYVIRKAKSFPYSQFKNSVAKYVRKGHIQTQKHWRAGRHFKQNKLLKDITLMA